MAASMSPPNCSARRYTSTFSVSSAAAVYDKTEDSIILIYEGRQKNTDEVGTALKNRLPHYMLPQRIIRIKAMPINANGKTDRKWLTANYKNI